jgi:hypothetical protein
VGRGCLGRPWLFADLAAAFAGPDSVHLGWTAPGDPGGTGRAAAYDLRLTTVKSRIGSADANVPHLVAPAPGAAGASEGVTLPAPEPGVTCWYWLYASDGAGNRSGCSNTVGFTRPLGPVLPDDAADGLTLAVRQRPSRVPVVLAWSGASATDIRLYDVSGRLVRNLRLARGGRGTEEWNGRDETGRLVPAGLYFARLSGGSLHAQARIVFLP